MRAAVRAAGLGTGFPTTAVPGIARSIIRFTANVIPDPDHPDTADTLEAMPPLVVLAHRARSIGWSCSA
ncbi:hypothetical protein AB0L10_44635 [Streptomyces flaveolus]|uniref:hypothetical protein n=1 Tax=Streptomyces flaveolus TaxID=67297 RepID=UPI00343D7B44